MRNIIIAICIIGVAFSITSKNLQDVLQAEMETEHVNEHDQLIFRNWMLEYGRSYDNEFTAIHRMQIFMRNKKEIEKHNRFTSKYKAKLNEFSDQDYDELAHKMFMHIDLTDEHFVPSTSHFFSKKDLSELKNHPILNQMREKAQKGDTLDWSKQVPGSKPQGTCGSCWAFSSSDVAVSRLALKGKTELTQLSKTHLIDCCVGDKNKGCQGGSPINAFKFIGEHGALRDNEYRDYDGTQQECSKPEGHIGKGDVADVNKVDDPDFEAIKDALQDGPVTALMWADKSWFQYSSGIIDTCSYVGSKDGSHAVVIVGYGKEHYVVKNSWGTGWGENGFFQVQRTGPSECLDKIKKISYPIIQ